MRAMDFTTTDGTRRAPTHAIRKAPVWVQIMVVAVFAGVWACGCTEMMVPGGGGSEAARLVLEDLDGAILSITGRSSSDVYAVGGDSRDGEGPMFIHYDGSQWQRILTGVTQGDLWWISVNPIDGQYYMCGANGLILSYNIGSGEVQSYETPGDFIVFGIWGAASDDIWAVGGDVETKGSGFIWHYDGQAWTAIPPDTIAEGGFKTLYKIWGRSANEIYTVGQDGTAFRYDGTKWSAIDVGTTRTLFTVHGDDDVVLAAGGSGSAVIVEDDGSGFVEVGDPSIPQMNGAYATPELRITAGVGGSFATFNEGQWGVLDTPLNTILDFHAVWVDPDGGVWAVGGDLNVGGLNQGIVAYMGSESISSTFAP